MEHQICLAWGQLDVIRTPPEITTDFFYSASLAMEAYTKRTLQDPEGQGQKNGKMA